MRINREIRAPKVRVISSTGEQVGIMSPRDALKRAEDEGLDLVEIAPNANPPVCKIIDYGKFRYDQTKREKESKKASHQIKVKEVKVKPNINEHDLQTKMRHAKDFLEKGNKVKVTCMFRGREMAHKSIGERLIQRIVEDLNEVAVCETPMKMFGRFLTVVLAPHKNKK
ncbi:translation initiation factor IF-3 [Waddlia chondrophila]|uniref:Translation initiation factor IF-3 n=2 Tax=Waddlia chondrophila TaxID=71667 RepID=D6YVW4_WADCW|nr:translation initiation factor IF-3 [Waddlia chondrophila]ADI38275.1 Translation initiation factor IF-3 [Waddlia chondrophila WSU 86-1044]